jgi:hypothetical protein
VLFINLTLLIIIINQLRLILFVYCIELVLLLLQYIVLYHFIDFATGNKNLRG